MERSWTLGDDLITSDNLLDGVTFDDLILAVHCSSREVNRAYWPAYGKLRARVRAF